MRLRQTVCKGNNHESPIPEIFVLVVLFQALAHTA
jgi:hypothetical protein